MSRLDLARSRNHIVLDVVLGTADVGILGTATDHEDLGDRTVALLGWRARGQSEKGERTVWRDTISDIRAFEQNRQGRSRRQRTLNRCRP